MSAAQEAHFRARMDGIAASRTAAAANNKELHALAKERIDLTRESRRRTANSAQNARNAATHGQAASDPFATSTTPTPAPETESDPFI